MELKKPYIVYAKVNDNGYITAVNSSEFLTDITGWTEVDSGYGDKYCHAQGNYFAEHIFTDSGVCRYKVADGKAVGCTAEEMKQQEADSVSGKALPTLEDRVDTLEMNSTEIKEALEMILAGVTE